MEIIEVVTFHLNNLEEVLEVTFRTNTDGEDVIRESKIPFVEIEDFGYKFHNEDEIDFDVDEEEYDDFEDDDLFVGVHVDYSLQTSTTPVNVNE